MSDIVMQRHLLSAEWTDVCFDAAETDAAQHDSDHEVDALPLLQHIAVLSN